MSDDANPLYVKENEWRDNSSGELRSGAARATEASSHVNKPDRPPLFSGIPAADYQKIIASARLKEFVRGEMLFIEGDPVDQIVLVTAGFVKVTQLGPGGDLVILRFAAPGDVLDTTTLFSTGTHCRTAQALRLCQTLVWDERAFRALMDRFPILHRNMARVLGEDLVELEERFREVATERVASRVARQLARLVEKIGRPANGDFEVCLSREELAQMTGTTLFTVSRLLSAWEDRGLLKPRREGVTICDVSDLRSVSD
jgi:CRP-like cAMP-binding protein